MKIGQAVQTFNNNWFSSFVLGVSENGTSLDIPIHLSGKVVELKEKSKTGHTVGVLFIYGNNDEHKLKAYLKPNTLKMVTQ